MADASSVVEETRSSVQTALDYQQHDLVSRAEWGTLSFEEAQHDYDRIFGILGHLVVLPLEQLTDQAIKQIKDQAEAVAETLEKVHTFSIETGNPTQIRSQLVSEVHQKADALYENVTPWIPYLAYARGDVEQNIQALTTSVTEARDLITTAEKEIREKGKSIDKIITAAREASAAAGAAVFTKDFDAESTALTNKAKTWLGASAILAAATIALAVVIFFVAEAGLDTGQLVQKSAARLVVLAVLFTGALWCGRVYKALLHQAAINRHRALSLQTFQAFSRAASDDATRDAVLLEATRAVFGSVPTGLLDSDSPGASGLQVVEVARRISEPAS